VALSGEDAFEVPIDRHGRLVLPPHLRRELGPMPGVVTARRVGGGVLLAAPPLGELAVADDGLPVLVLDETVTNGKVLTAIDHERDHR
jgi:bifunctional DNA-binding transcriptional regulator/antitoxin component of YhaV-PrlF toxin-antitoxin module